MQTRSSASASADHRRESQLQIVDTTSTRRKRGLTIVNQPRSSSASGKYFVEPGTGTQFPSIESADRYSNRDNTRFYEASRTKQNHRSLEYASKGFRLPKGWTVDEIPRNNSYRIDKQYVERKTGKRFRSLVSVERYLKESRNPTVEQPMLLQYHPHSGRSKDFSLPDGWMVEEKPRKSSNQIDKSYIELETGKKFRSLASVERYLQAVRNTTVYSGSMVHSEQLLLTMNRDDNIFQKEVIDVNPPKKVKWILTGPGGNMFTPNVNGSDVSDSVKQKWSEAFVTLIQDRFYQESES